MKELRHEEATQNKKTIESLRAQRKTDIILKSIVQKNGLEASKVQQEELKRMQNKRDKQLVIMRSEKYEQKLPEESKRKQMEIDFVRYDLLGQKQKR